MNKIPTTEELFKKYKILYHFEEGSPEYLIDKEDFKTAIIEHTKLHVKAALEAASEEAIANHIESWGQRTGEIEIDKDSILNAYPENLIK